MVLELHEKTGRKYSLMLNGEKYCRCYPGDLRGLGFSELTVGQETEVSGEILAEFERTVFLPRAKKRSLMLLGKKEYTSREMTKKLMTDGYPEAVTEAVLSWLADLHYVDDFSYAERYAFSLLSRHSEREIQQKMQQKGLDRELIKDALAVAKDRYREEHTGGDMNRENGDGGLEFSAEQEAIRTVLRKKGYRPEAMDAEKKQKLVMSLYRKGFSLSDIRTVIGEFEGDVEF